MASAASTAGKSKSFSHLVEIIPDHVWMFSTPFRFFGGLLPINNNGLIIRARRKGTGEPVLVAANAPELSPSLVNDINQVQTSTGAKVEVVLGTDWHHLFTKSWAEAFPGVQVLFSGTRGWRQHEQETFNKQVLDRKEPTVPDVDESTLKLVPWLGFDGVSTHHPDDKRRGEFSVYLPEHKLLYIFDVLIPMIPFKRMLGFHATPPTESEMPTPGSNFGKKLAGFRIAEPELCAQSAKALLALDVETLCFSHGDMQFGAVRRGKQSVAAAMAGLKTLIPPQ